MCDAARSKRWVPIVDPAVPMAAREWSLQICVTTLRADHSTSAPYSGHTGQHTSWRSVPSPTHSFYIQWVSRKPGQLKVTVTVKLWLWLCGNNNVLTPFWWQTVNNQLAKYNALSKTRYSDLFNRFLRKWSFWGNCLLHKNVEPAAEKNVISSSFQ